MIPKKCAKTCSGIFLCHIGNDGAITGFSRTGKWFACQHWDYSLDIMCFAKGMSSGYVPVGGAATTTKIAEKVESGPFMELVSFPTWGGNPVSSAGALTNIAIIERENLVDNSAICYSRRYQRDWVISWNRVSSR